MTERIAHVESRCEWPEPLAGGFWDPRTLALPATAISASSLTLFCLAAVLLWRSAELRVLFELPIDPVFLALATSAWTFAIAVACRPRPGGSFARYWVLALFLGSGLLAVAHLWGGELFDRSVLHTLTAAGAGAALTLTPRLWPLRPDQRLLQLISPVTLGLALTVLLPIVFWLGEDAVERGRREVEAEIERLETTSTRVRDLVDYDWGDMGRDRRRARRRVEDFRGLSLHAPERGQAWLWRAATVLRRDGDLTDVWRRLLGLLTRGLTADRGPRLSALGEPPAYYDWRLQTWRPQSGYEQLGAIVSSYHWHLDRLFEEAKIRLTPEVESATPANLAAYYRQCVGQLEERSRALIENWSDHWVLWVMAGQPARLPEPAAPLEDLLMMPLRPGPGAVVPGRLTQLIGLELADAMLLRDHAACFSRELDPAPQGLLQVSCFTFITADGGTTARVRGDVHFLYSVTDDSPVPPATLPQEVRLIFHVPAGDDVGGYAERVMESLLAAARDDGTRIETAGPGPTAGFHSHGTTSGFAAGAPLQLRLRDGRVAIQVAVKPRRPSS